MILSSWPLRKRGWVRCAVALGREPDDLPRPPKRPTIRGDCRAWQQRHKVRSEYEAGRLCAALILCLLKNVRYKNTGINGEFPVLKTNPLFFNMQYLENHSLVS